jgi:dihydrodipicolinate synthase/N-acetylneuraminate lyase
MDDPGENFLVQLYYTNFPFFVFTATGADTGLILAFLYGKYPELRVYQSFVFATAFTSFIICMKMVINVSQWTGSIKKLRKYDNQKKGAEKPIVLYSIPSRCGIEISVDVTARLYEAYPHVCCMKAAEGSCEKVVEYVRALGPDFAVMSGDDGLILPFMSAGATGVISVASNLVVSPLVQMVQAANNNDYATARETYLKYYPFFKAIFLEPNPVPIKYALKQAGIIQSDEVRLPLSGLTDGTRQLLDTLFTDLSLF